MQNPRYYAMLKNSKSQQEEENPVPLKLLRQKAGLSRVKLAAILGIDPSTLYLCEKGLSELRLTSEQWQILAQTFGISKVCEMPKYLGKAPQN